MGRAEKDPPRHGAEPPPELADIDVLTVLQALSDPVRLEIVRQLAGCPDSAGGLACGHIELPVTKSTATHHFKTLMAAGITHEREEGTRKFVSLRRCELDERFPGLVDLVVGKSRS
ncbi:MAG: helix-turn-helix transcriptional regulator [Acidimicrobiales bacterium]|nr:helix-turn-helix transcriptional regulator [Acidimicrobiales bacterium]